MAYTSPKTWFAGAAGTEWATDYRHELNMDGLKVMQTKTRPVLMWETLRWSDPSLIGNKSSYSFDVLKEFEGIRDFILVTPSNSLDVYDEVEWYLRTNGYRVYGIALGADMKLPYYTWKELSAPNVVVTRAPWVPSELMGMLINEVVRTEATGLYPLIPQPFALYDLAKKLHLEVKSWEERQRGMIRWNERETLHSLRALNENALSLELQAEFWVSYIAQSVF